VKEERKFESIEGEGGHQREGQGQEVELRARLLLKARALGPTGQEGEAHDANQNANRWELGQSGA
jgi:hypothetical protein